MIPKIKLTRLIKEEAARLGFEQCGISKAMFLDKEAPRLEKWLNKGMHGTMKYMEQSFDKRLDPRRVVDDAKSVISLSLNYFTGCNQEHTDAPIISKYVYGADYHEVLKKKLNQLIDFIGKKAGQVNSGGFVDSSSVFEKAWAVRSGLGWAGKHSVVINEDIGSFQFLGDIILDLPLEYDGPVADRCLNCRKCMDACPTGAIEEPYVMNASKCISYFTIELKEAIPAEMAGKFKDRAYGCDICQDVCPWNKKAKLSNEKSFAPNPEFLSMTRDDWKNLDEAKFNRIFKGTAMVRAKFHGIKRNLDFLDPDTLSYT